MVIIDGDNVRLPMVVFDRLVSQVWSMCDLKAEVEELKSMHEKVWQTGNPSV